MSAHITNSQTEILRYGFFRLLWCMKREDMQKVHYSMQLMDKTLILFIYNKLPIICVFGWQGNCGLSILWIIRVVAKNEQSQHIIISNRLI